MLDAFSHLALGAVLGFFGGLLGIGGGLFAIPALSLMYAMEQQLAQGTALAMVVPNILLGLYHYNQRNRINWRLAAILASAAFVCSWVGATLTLQFSGHTARLLFVVFLLIIAGWNLVQLSGKRRDTSLTQVPRLWFASLGGLGGLLGGLFGIGTAVIATPMMTLFFGASQVVAQGLALSIAVPTTAVTLFSYSLHGQVAWVTGLTMALGSLTTIGYGVRIAHRLPEKTLKLAFTGFVVLCAGLMASQL